jgi:hypothetical protein
MRNGNGILLPVSVHFEELSVRLYLLIGLGKLDIARKEPGRAAVL